MTVGTDNKALVNDDPAPKFGVLLKVDAAKGLFSGTFIDPKFTAKKTVLKFGGVILQNVSTGFGSFSGSTPNNTGLQTGSVTADLR